MISGRPEALRGLFQLSHTLVTSRHLSFPELWFRLVLPGALASGSLHGVGGTPLGSGVLLPCLVTLTDPELLGKSLLILISYLPVTPSLDLFKSKALS